MAAQPAVVGGRVVMVDPVTDRAGFSLPPQSPGAAMLSGPRTPVRPPVPASPVITMPPAPGTIGRLARLPGGPMIVTPTNFGQPTAQFAVTPPGINTDPPPGAGQLIQQVTDGGYVVYPLSYLGYGITSNAGDEGQINDALLKSLPQGAPVRLAPYPFLTQGPVALPASALGASVLEGTCPVVGEAAGTAGAGIFGAVIRPQATWAGGGLPNSGAVYLAPTVPNGGTKMFGPVLRNFWVDLRGGPAGIWGVSVYGQVNHGVMQGMGVWGNPADTTSDNLHFDQDAGAEGVNYPDGWSFDTVISQSHGRYGLFGYMNDSALFGVHVQANAVSTTDSGCFYFPKANNVRLIGCRADQGVWGFIFDTNPGGVPNTPGATVLMEGCGSERIYHAALLLTNSSSTGQQTRTPVAATGCSFDYAGRDGVSAAVQVEGWNILTMWNCNITNGGFAFPQIGLQTKSIGSGPGVPSLVVVDGGMWNPAAGGAYFADSAPATTLRYRIYGAIGAVQGGGAPVNPTLQKSAAWP